MQLCSKPRGARGIEPETFRRRGQLLSCPPTTGPVCCVPKNMSFQEVPGLCSLFHTHEYCSVATCLVCWWFCLCHCFCQSLLLSRVIPGLCCFLRVTRRKLQTPGNAEEHKRQETPTISPCNTHEHLCNRTYMHACMHAQENNRSNTTPDPCRSQPQRPYEQGWTYAKQ